jgi:RimJ/RimL family protein N-acetyltransferase
MHAQHCLCSVGLVGVCFIGLTVQVNFLMAQRTNSYGQPIGAALPDWQPHSWPKVDTLTGTYCRIERISAERHGPGLFAAFSQAPDGRDWTYSQVGPFADESQYVAYAAQCETSLDPMHFAIIDVTSGEPVGTMALARIDPKNGSIEIGYLVFSPLLKQTRMATEAHYLTMEYCFDQLGYRRYEWKCDSLNQPSLNAASRLGFQFEGTFRQAVVYKGRSRDTCWLSITDAEWPALKLRFQRWLSADNFDEVGKQKQSLQSLR